MDAALKVGVLEEEQTPGIINQEVFRRSLVLPRQRYYTSDMVAQVEWPAWMPSEGVHRDGRFRDLAMEEG